jgi:putative mycofactocin binding protein MftB
MAARYKLNEGTQVREEDFGLLFYTQSGPRLFFFPSGAALGCDFFGSDIPLDQWVTSAAPDPSSAAPMLNSLKNALDRLAEKGVIIEF